MGRHTDRTDLGVEFGAPIEFDGRADPRQAEACTDRIMRGIAAMLPERYRGAYGPGSEGQTVVARQEPTE